MTCKATAAGNRHDCTYPTCGCDVDIDIDLARRADNKKEKPMTNLKKCENCKADLTPEYPYFRVNKKLPHGKFEPAFYCSLECKKLGAEKMLKEEEERHAARWLT